MTNPPPGWYPDTQSGSNSMRYWDGQAWTNQTAASAYAVPIVPEKKTERNGLAITGFVLGLASVLSSCMFVGGIFGIAGIIFSILGLKSRYRGLAIAGLITSVVGILITVLMIVGILFSLPYLDSLNYSGFTNDKFY